MRKKTFSIIAIVLFAMQHVSAVPAIPTPINYALPDGSEITICLRGDERLNWRVSTDGYTLLFNKDGYLEYATQDQFGDLQPSGIRAKNVPERTVDEKNFLMSQSKNLRYSSSQIKALQKLRGMRENAIKNFSKNPRKVSGTVRAPLILVAFKNKPFTKTKADFEALCNNLNYTSTPDGTITGSVRDYFAASSYGQLDFQVDVFGPYTLPNNISYYDDESYGDPRVMARQAADSAYKHGCDFSDYDLDNDGFVDMMHVIYAGYDQSAGAPAGQAIWAHAWYFESPVTLGSTKVYDYSCSSELRETFGGKITHIGVVSHELSHVFGLPDLYDTDYGSSGYAVDMGDWDIMAGGSWNDDGRTPAFHSAWCRAKLGWIPVVTIDKPNDIRLPNPADTGIAYRINTTQTGEYFLLENRQKQGWDAFVPGSGLLIYHVDENYSGWGRNCGNCNPNHRGLYVKQAGCGNNSNCDDDYYTDENERSTDPFPQPGKTEFTDNSTPNSKSWAGASTEKSVTNIIHNTVDRAIEFTFMGGAPDYIDVSLTEFVDLPERTYSENLRDIKVKVLNNAGHVYAATIAWSINGEAQTPYEWTGHLRPYQEMVLTLTKKMPLNSGKYAFEAVLTVPDDSIVTDDRIAQTVFVKIPFFKEDFEDETSGWTLQNGTQTNKWIVGSNTANGGTRAAYISDGNVNQYTLSSASKVHLFRDISFPESTDSLDFDLLFDVKGRGERKEDSNGEGKQDSIYVDYLEVRMVDPNVTPTSDVQLEQGMLLGKFVDIAEWQSIYISLPASYAHTTQRLVFSWYNDEQEGNQPPAAIDNVVFASHSLITDIKDLIDSERPALQAWVQNNTLYIKGLTNRQTYHIYNISGTLIKQGIATSDVVVVDIQGHAHGTYIIQQKALSTKVIW